MCWVSSTSFSFPFTLKKYCFHTPFCMFVSFLDFLSLLLSYFGQFARHQFNQTPMCMCPSLPMGVSTCCVRLCICGNQETDRPIALQWPFKPGPPPPADESQGGGLNQAWYTTEADMEVLFKIDTKGASMNLNTLLAYRHTWTSMRFMKKRGPTHILKDAERAC